MKIDKTKLFLILNNKHKSIYDLIYSGISQYTIIAITMNNVIEFADILKICSYLRVNLNDFTSYL